MMNHLVLIIKKIECFSTIRVKILKYIFHLFTLLFFGEISFLTFWNLIYPKIRFRKSKKIKWLSISWPKAISGHFQSLTSLDTNHKYIRIYIRYRQTGIDSSYGLLPSWREYLLTKWIKGYMQWNSRWWN